MASVLVFASSPPSSLPFFNNGSSTFLLLFLATLLVTEVLAEATTTFNSRPRDRRELTMAKPWGLQSGPDSGDVIATGMVYDADSDVLFLAGTTQGQSETFPHFVPRDDLTSGDVSDCFLATVQLPNYQDQEKPPPDWHSAYRMGISGSGAACLSLARAPLVVQSPYSKHKEEDDEQKIQKEEEQQERDSRLYALGIKYDFDPIKQKSIIQETLVDVVVDKETGFLWNFQDMTPLNSNDGVHEFKALDPVDLATDPESPTVWTVSQAMGTDYNVKEDFLEIALSKYTVLSPDRNDAEVQQLLWQDFKVALNTDEDVSAIVTTLTYAEKHKVLLMAGSTSGSGTAFGGKDLPPRDEDSNHKDWNGFLVKLDPSTGTVASNGPGAYAKRIFSALADDVVIEHLCLDETQKHLYLVGSAQSNILKTGDDNDLVLHDDPGGAFLVKLEFDSLEVLWAQEIPGHRVRGTACQVSPVDGSVFFAGEVPEEVNLPEEKLFFQDVAVRASAPTGTHADVFCAKVDADTGSIEWLSHLGSGETDTLAPNGGGLVVDRMGNPILYGTTFGSMVRHKDRHGPAKDLYSDVFVIQLSGKDGSRQTQPNTLSSKYSPDTNSEAEDASDVEKNPWVLPGDQVTKPVQLTDSSVVEDKQKCVNGICSKKIKSAVSYAIPCFILGVLLVVLGTVLVKKHNRRRLRDHKEEPEFEVGGLFKDDSCVHRPSKQGPPADAFQNDFGGLFKDNDSFHHHSKQDTNGLLMADTTEEEYFAPLAAVDEQNHRRGEFLVAKEGTHV